MRKLEVNRIYKHFKGDYYIVLGTGINSETLEEYVIYRALYGEGKVYLREINNFDIINFNIFAFVKIYYPTSWI